METENFDFSGGSNLDTPPHLLSSNEARLIQDAFVNPFDGGLIARGAVTPYTGTSGDFLHGAPQALVSCTNPVGVVCLALVQGDSATGINFTTINGTSLRESTNTSTAIGTISAPLIIQVSPAPNGVMIGFSTQYNTAAAIPTQGILYWGGSLKTNYTNTATTTTRGSTAVTCTSGFTANVDAGMWVYSGSVLIGQVKKVVSDTSITLVRGATKAVAAGSVDFKPLRGLYNIPMVMGGEITTSATLATVTGGDTKWLVQLAGGSVWDVFRWEDFTYEGTVTSVQSDIGMTFTGNAAHDNLQKRYVAINNSSSTTPYAFTSVTKAGFLPAYYAGHMWYANNGNSRESTFRIYFSDFQNEDAIDTTVDGDWFEVRSSTSDTKPIRGTVDAHNSLLVFKENETFAIYGTDPDSFYVQRVHDDGLTSPMTIQRYRGGVIWAGRRGVYYYDGASVTNLLEGKMASTWKNSTDASVDGASMWSMLSNNKYYISFYMTFSSVSMRRAASTYTPFLWTMVIDLDNGNITFLSNVLIRGSVEHAIPSVGRVTLYAVPRATYTTGAYLCLSSTLEYGVNVSGDVALSKDVSGNNCAEGVAGPNFYVESRKFTGDDPDTLKKFRQLTLNYNTETTTLTTEQVVGQNPAATSTWSSYVTSLGTLTVPGPTTGWTTARLQTGKVHRFWGFTVYGTLTNTAVKLGTCQIKYKRLRPWRVVRPTQI